MADTAGNLDKLSRLKSLKTGLQARNASADRGDEPSLDTLLQNGSASSAKPVPEAAPARPAPERPAAAKPAPEKEDGDESLSAYFEALGILPDGSRKSGATGTPPKPYAPPSDAYTKPAAPKPDEKGRDVDMRDRWADPVREDGSYLSSFAGDPPAQPGETPVPAEEAASVVPRAAGPVLETVEDEGEVSGSPEAGSPVSDPSGFVQPEEAEEEMPVAVEEASDFDLPDDLPDDLPVDLPDDLPDDTPEDTGADFDRSIDIEAFEREIAMADSARRAEIQQPETSDAPEANPESGEPLSITFDPGRAAMLEQVSKQMGCSVDDVVVTAIDWYLDALLGDEADAENTAT